MASQTVSVLSIRQPHADNIIFGDKWCENRTWRTRYRGPIFIHASRWDGPSDQPTPGAGVIGAIIGRADLVDVVDLDAPGASLSTLQSAAKKHGLSTKAASMKHVCGPVCFLLTNPKALIEPIPCSGKLNIWKKEVDTDRLTFGQPQIAKPLLAASKATREPKTIGVGTRVNYKRANFYVVEVNDELVGVAKTRNGPIVDWLDESDVELGSANERNDLPMPRYFTFHWRQEFWRPDVNSDGEAIRASGSNVFRQRHLDRDDVLYIVSLIDGYMYLGGKLLVRKIVTRKEAIEIFGNPNRYNAKEWAINKDGMGCTPLNLKRRLAPEVTRKLTHKSGKGFFFERGTQRLYGQATRGLQEIDDASAALLDQIIEITDRMPRKDGTLTVSEDLICNAGINRPALANPLPKKRQRIVGA